MAYQDGNDLKTYIPGVGFLVTSLESGESHMFEDPLMKLDEREDAAYCAGYAAREAGQQIGTNPYSPDSQPKEYEAWLDGWSWDSE